MKTGYRRTRLSFNESVPRNPAKQRIARAASRLIEFGETLLVNGGSTTALFASEIERQKVTIVTNNLALAAAVPLGRAVYLLGAVAIITMLKFPGCFSKINGSATLSRLE